MRLTVNRPRIADAARWCAVTAGVFVLASGGFRSSGLEESELNCEETAAHLRSCCPDFPVAEVSCDFIEGCNSTVEPFFDRRTSECLQASPCSVLRAKDGACERITKVLQQRHGSADTGTSEPLNEEVCP